MKVLSCTFLCKVLDIAESTTQIGSMKRLALVLLLISCGVRGPKIPPLVEAVRNGDAATSRALLAKGSDPNAPAGVNGWSPLLHAVHKNQIATATVLLDAGAEVDRTGSNGMTPLMMAAGYGNRDMVELLLRHGATAAKADRNGETARDYALSGVTDIDRFTYFSCQDDTAKLLAAAPAQKSSISWARRKGCRV